MSLHIAPTERFFLDTSGPRFADMVDSCDHLRETMLLGKGTSRWGMKLWPAGKYCGTWAGSKSSFRGETVALVCIAASTSSTARRSAAATTRTRSRMAAPVRRRTRTAEWWSRPQRARGW